MLMMTTAIKQRVAMNGFDFSLHKALLYLLAFLHIIHGQLHTQLTPHRHSPQTWIPTVAHKALPL